MQLLLVLKDAHNVTLGDIQNIVNAIRKAGYGVKTLPDTPDCINPKAIRVGKV